MPNALTLVWRPLAQRATAPAASTAPAGRRSAPASADEDGALVAACRRNDDAAAFAALVRRHQERVFRLALSVLGPGAEMDAEDVTQEVFLRVHRQLSGFRGESSFRSWLYRVTFNLAVDRRRLARWRLPHVGEEPLGTLPNRESGADPFAVTAAAERGRAIRRALQTLPDVVRAVVHLHYWMDLSVDEIGEILGVRPGTVKSHLHRGRQRLHDVLDAEGVRSE